MVNHLFMFVFSNHRQNSHEIRFLIVACINTCMDTFTGTDNTQQKLALDQTLVGTLIDLGIISSVTDLSRQMGKNDTYYACMRNRGYGLHLGSLVFLAAKLSHQMANEASVRERARLRTAVSAINENIQAKCKLREQELLAQ